MKREIEFRGKRIDNGEWVYGDLEYSRRDDAAFIHTYGPTKAYAGRFRVDPETVGQYSEYHDDSGKRLFEGDILDLYIPKNQIGKSEHRIRKVTFVHNGFNITDKHNNAICDKVPTCLECIYTLIGNIYDNPELLEGGEK